MIGYIDLNVENNVIRKETNSLLTGIFSDKEIGGWNYDIHLLEDALARQKYNTEIGGHNVGLHDGFAKTDWSSGTINNISYDYLQALKDRNTRLWTPIYQTGAYSIFADNRTLYSDYSYMGKMQSFNQGLAWISLRDDCKQDTISCSIYKRELDGTIFAETRYQLVDSFTGDLVDNERLPTETDTGFILNNISLRHNEFVIRNEGLYSNLKALKGVGVGNSVEEVTETWEKHSVEAGGSIFLTYLNPLNVEIAVVDNNDVDFLSKLETIDYLLEDRAGFSVDEDLGIIHVTGKTANPISLRYDIHELETEITCYYNDDFISLPERGVLLIDNELIAYQGKGLTSIMDCIRGYGGTSAEEHSVGAQAIFHQQGSFLSGDYYVKYKIAPRVEYEVTTYNKRTANKTNWLNVHPLANLKSNKIIQIVSQTVNLAELVLTTDEPLLGGNLFGPIYFGTDVADLTVLALDANGLPVEEIEVTLEKVYGSGSIDFSADSIVESTNSSGEIYGVYNAPYDEAGINLDVSDMSYDGDDTLIIVPALSTGVLPSDVFLYQVFKHDPSLGTVGKKVKAVAAGTAVEPWGAGFIDVRCEYTEDFNNGLLQIVYNSVRYSFAIRQAARQEATGEESLTRFFVEEYNPILTSSPFSESTVWLYEADAEIWDPTLKRGADVIVYEWSTDYLHPKTKTAGAYGPVRASSISGTTIRYSGRHLPLAQPTNDESNLGAYKIISPSESRFRAFAKDPFTGNTVTSNEIRVKIILPNTLRGVDSSGTLPVPYGFTFITDDFNVGAGLGGSNFITVNPSASSIGQFSLRGQI